MPTMQQDTPRNTGVGPAPDLAPLAGDWALWRDFAVRSAGFPVAGLDAFGAGDESSRLRGVARDPLFREAVTWQNPAALANAVAKLGDGGAGTCSKERRREDVVASYWQRYCSKNDTIGFFGPLAWGRIDDGAPALATRGGALVRSRAVHLEAWGVQALAETLDPELRVGAGPQAERDLRRGLERHPDPAVRSRGLDALGRLEAARDALAAARPGELGDALAALDATFVELTGRAPTRHHGRAYGARTLAYVDCMRDLDVTLGAALVQDVAPALRVLFEACRWYCGEVHAIGRRIVHEALPAGRRGPFAPVLARVMAALMRLPPELDDVVAELHRRLAGVLAGADPATAGERAAAAFADRRGAWRTAVFQSVDLQLAARDAAAIAAGDHLAVVGDVHPGANPLVQGLFAHRHPDLRGLRRLLDDAVGPYRVLLLPPFGPGMGVEARGVPLTFDDDVHIAVMPETRAQGGRRTWLPHELSVDGDDVVDRDGALRVPVLDAFGMAIFIAGVRAFELYPGGPHTARVTLGRTVLRRECWRVPAAAVPGDARALAAFGRDRGMPRRVFAKSPLERKPMYVDLDSPSLARILCRHAARAAREAPGQPLRFTEMLPAPEQCWLADAEANRYVSELRLVAIDRSLADR